MWPRRKIWSTKSESLWKKLSHGMLGRGRPNKTFFRMRANLYLRKRLQPVWWNRRMHPDFYVPTWKRPRSSRLWQEWSIYCMLQSLFWIKLWWLSAGNEFLSRLWVLGFWPISISKPKIRLFSDCGPMCSCEYGYSRFNETGECIQTSMCPYKKEDYYPYVESSSAEPSIAFLSMAYWWLISNL